MTWLRRIRGALLMGLIWAMAWAPIGVLLSFVVDRDGSMDEPWVLIGAFPGFLIGVVFSIVLGIVAGRRRLVELSAAKAAGWGALAGLLLGVLVFVAGDQGADVERVWLLPLIVITSFAALGSVSAAASLALAQRGDRRGAPDGSATGA